MDFTVSSTQNHKPTIRRKLIWLTLACVLPAATMMAVLIGLQWQEGQERQQRDVLLTAQAMARSVESDFAGLTAALAVLGDSPTLHTGELGPFREEADNARRTLGVANIALADSTGQLLMDLSQAPGAPLTTHPARARLARLADRAASQGNGALSELSELSDVSGRHAIALWVPIRGEGGTVFVLEASVQAERVARVFSREALPPTWIASVYDAAGHIVARTHEADRFVGEKARAETLQSIRGAGGSFDGLTVKGTPVRYTYSRSPEHGWTVTIGIPRSELTAQVLRTVAGLVLASAVLVAGGLLLAFVMGDRIRIGMQTRELKEAYQIARASEQRVRTIIEAAQDPFIAVDLRGRIIDWNSSAELAFGWSRDEILGQRVAETLLPARFAASLDPALNTFLATGTSEAVGQRVERLLVDRHGHERTFEVKIGFVDTGEQRFFAAFLHDISRRKEVERLKAEFVSTVSHELRTPLTAIYGSLSLLGSGAAGALPKPATDLARLSLQSCERLVRLVNDILDVEKFASGRADYVFRMQSVRSMVEQAVGDTQPFADGFGVRLCLAPGADVEVRADRDRIVQVAVNLLSNAAKFSPQGADVEVAVDILDDRVRVAVADRGPGVPEEFRTRMFERFAQADTSDRRLKGGTGLGLNICRSIMTAHGGRIDFTSVPGVRTEFFFELPRPGNDAAAG